MKKLKNEINDLNNIISNKDFVSEVKEKYDFKYLTNSNSNFLLNTMDSINNKYNCIESSNFNNDNESTKLDVELDGKEKLSNHQVIELR